MVASAQDKKIGLLGGSFNPAHQGHVYISEQALEILDLDEIWWIVSRQNPLKQKAGMMPFAMRFAVAKDITSQSQKIHISDIEQHSGTGYTYDTLALLKSQNPEHKFVWIMGADNLIQFPKWYKWREILASTPIAVFNRGGYKDEALAGIVAAEFSSNRVVNPARLALSATPAWVFIDIETPKISATDIRNGN